jgi:hypothetical protein
MNEIEINGEKYVKQSNLSDGIWEVGKNYFIRTVTMHLVGNLSHIDHRELVLRRASWIADSGRFHDALKHGAFNEIEPFVNDVIVNRSSIIDATIYCHVLPDSQK